MTSQFSLVPSISHPSSGPRLDHFEKCALEQTPDRYVAQLERQPGPAHSHAQLGTLTAADPALLSSVPPRHRLTSAVHVKVDSMPVAIIRDGDGFEIRADFKRLKWERYGTIGQGIQKIVTRCLKLESEAVSVFCSLFIDEGRATARLSIELPPSYRQQLASPALQQAIEGFMDQLKSGDSAPILDEDTESPSLVDYAEVGDSDASDSEVACAPSVPPLAHAEVREIAREVRAIVGGCTLPMPCAIESAAWSRTFEVCGKLAAKPRSEKVDIDPVSVNGDFRIDGFIRSKGVVYLVSKNSPSEVKEMAFDEETLLARIIECSSLDAPLCFAVYEEMSDGLKKKRTLLHLSRCSGEVVQ